MIASWLWLDSHPHGPSGALAIKTPEQNKESLRPLTIEYDDDGNGKPVRMSPIRKEKMEASHTESVMKRKSDSGESKWKQRHQYLSDKAINSGPIYRDVSAQTSLLHPKR